MKILFLLIFRLAEKSSNVWVFFLSQTLENSMSSATTLSTPQDQVESLMKQIAEENDLDITEQLTDLNPTTASIREDTEKKKEDDLSRRCVWNTNITFILQSDLNKSSH